MNKNQIASLFCALAMVPATAMAAPPSTDITRGDETHAAPNRVDPMGARTESDRVAGLDATERQGGDHVQEIRGVIGGLIKTALGNDIEGYVDYLAESDRERLEDIEDKISMEELKQTTSAIQTSWDQKFANVADRLDFDLASNELDRVLNFPFTLAADRKSATVQLPASGGSAPTTLRLVQEGTLMNAWRIDVPDTLTAVQLRTQLKSHLEQVRSSSGSWSNNQDEAMRSIARHVLEPLAIGSKKSA